LLAHSILYAQEFPDLLDGIFVSTDDAEIKSIALAYGAQVIDRPEALATDDSPTYRCLQHAIEQLEPGIEILYLLQPTNPLRPQHLLREAHSTFVKESGSSLFTVSRSHHKLGKIAHQQFVPFNYIPGQRSQDIEPLYFENGLLYITTPAVLAQNTVFNAEAIPFEVDHPYAQVDIDTQFDFEYAEYLVQKQNA
jgi:N-acylneuraminate cytidylyltransferase